MRFRPALLPLAVLVHGNIGNDTINAQASDDQVEGGACGAEHELRLPRRNVRVVHAAHDIETGHRVVGLDDLEAPAGLGSEEIASKPLAERTAVIRKDLRLAQPGAGHRERGDLHRHARSSKAAR